MNETVEQSRLQALVLRDDVKPPASFSPEIADISIRSPSNSLEDGYALRMSVSFGADEVRLETESHIITAEMSLSQARVELEFVSCSPSFSDLYSQKLESEQAEITHTVSAKDLTRRDTSGGVSGNVTFRRENPISVGLGGSAKISGERLSEISNEREARLVHRNFRHTSIDNVIIGDYQSNEVLKGTIVGDYEGWKVFPKPLARSGVLATLKVKQNWIGFQHVNVEKKKSAQASSSKLEDWFLSVAFGKAERHELFGILIKNLVYFKLQKPAEKNYATLGCSVLVVEPESGDFLQKSVESEVVEFSVRDQLFEDFISAESYEEALQIAERPYAYMLPKPIYEFPQCGPAEMLQRLGVAPPRRRLEQHASWEQETTRIATDKEIDDDIDFLKIPSGWSPFGGRRVHSTVAEPLKAIALQAERVPVFSAALQEMSFLKFGDRSKNISVRRKGFFLRRTFGLQEEKHDTNKRAARRHLDDYFSKVYKNRISDIKVNHKVTLASLWIEFILDVRKR